MGVKPPAAGQFLQFFRKKKTAILTPFGDILNVFRPIRKYAQLDTKIWKNLKEFVLAQPNQPLHAYWSSPKYV